MKIRRPRLFPGSLGTRLLINEDSFIACADGRRKLAFRTGSRREGTADALVVFVVFSGARSACIKRRGKHRNWGNVNAARVRNEKMTARRNRKEARRALSDIKIYFAYFAVVNAGLQRFQPFRGFFKIFGTFSARS